MGIEDFVPILLYGVLAFALLLHILLIVFVSRIMKDLIVSLERSKMCRVKQIEGETVRYTFLQSVSRNRRFHSTLISLFAVTLTLLVIAIVMYIWYKTKETDSRYDIWYNTRLVVYAIFIWFILLADAIIATVYMDKLGSTSDKYKKTMDVVTNAMATINKKYPIRNMLTEVYPDDVNELYTYILKRFINKNDDMSTEEGISGLTRLVDVKSYDELFGYLKLDVTYKDWQLVRSSFKNACKALNISGCDSKVAALEEALGSLQTYEPDKEYYTYKKMLMNFYIYAVVMIFVLLFPLFDRLYKHQGIVVIGVSSIVIGIVLSLYIFYNSAL